MKWRCPVCKKENQDKWKCDCGFDESRNYEKYRSIVRVTDRTKREYIDIRNLKFKENTLNMITQEEKILEQENILQKKEKVKEEVPKRVEKIKEDVPKKEERIKKEILKKEENLKRKEKILEIKEKEEKQIQKDTRKEKEEKVENNFSKYSCIFAFLLASPTIYIFTLLGLDKVTELHIWFEWSMVRCVFLGCVISFTGLMGGCMVVPKLNYKLRYWIIGIIPQVILVPVLTYLCLKFIWGVLGALLLGIGFGLFITEGREK